MASALIRIPAYAVGVTVCLLILPFEYLYLLGRKLVTHALIAAVWTLLAPFVLLASAVSDPELWPNYLRRWRRAHRSVRVRWRAPLYRIQDLRRWLPRRRRRRLQQPPQPVARRVIENAPSPSRASSSMA